MSPSSVAQVDGDDDEVDENELVQEEEAAIRPTLHIEGETESRKVLAVKGWTPSMTLEAKNKSSRCCQKMFSFEGP